MGLGNSAEKVKHKKGLWSPEEDEKLRDYVLRHGHGSWSSVPAQIGLQRNGKSCRLRWINYLRPGLKRGTFSRNEEEMILSLHRKLGNKWAQIAQRLPGRTDNEIKNHWHTNLKKRSSRTAPIKVTESQEINSYSTNVSSFSAISTSPKPISIPNNSMLPKVLFEEWLSVDRINVGRLDDHNYLWPSSTKFDHPFDDQAYNVSENTFLDNEFLSSLEYCDGMDIGIFPDSGLEDNSHLGEEFSNFGCSQNSNFEDNSPLEDHGIRNGFRQMYSF